MKKVVVIGGGTGVFTVLSALKRYPYELAAIVTMADDGGSTGVLREEFGILPPGDIRRALIALSSSDNKTLSELFNFRFGTNSSLRGHSLGNLLLTALEKITGSLKDALKEAVKILNVKGEVIPVTLSKTKLHAELENGIIIEGESNIDIPKHDPRLKIKKVYLDPQVTANPDATRAILEADFVILGPGDLYTSIIPNLLVPEITEAISTSEAHKIYVCNIMTQPGETTNYTVSDHIAAILEHANSQNIIEGVLVNDRHPEKLLETYKDKDQEPVTIDAEMVQSLGVRLIARALIKEENLVRHDPLLLAQAILLWHKRWQKYPLKKPIPAISSTVS